MPHTPAADTTPPIDTHRRRGLLGLLGGISALPLAACGGGGAGTDSSTLDLDDSTEASLARALAVSGSSCVVETEETEGPYPLRAILGNSAMVRADIREGRTGVALTLRIKLVDVNNSCAPITGAWVYIWHCDKDGLYSGYNASNNAGQANLTYLRGIQQTDSSGRVTFRTVYPGWYAGRITHVHCMVFLAGSSLGSSSSSAMATTQFAFPATITTAVYGSALYAKGQNTSVTSFASDNVFSDGTSTEMLTLSGSVAAGFAGGIVLGINQNQVSGGGGGGGTPPTRPSATS